MSAYDDAIGRARRLYAQRVTRDPEYVNGLAEMCAMFDPDREFEDAKERAELLIEYRPQRTVTFEVNVPDMDTTDQDVAERIEAALADKSLPFTVHSAVEVES